MIENGDLEWVDEDDVECDEVEVATKPTPTVQITPVSDCLTTPWEEDL